MNDLTNVSPDSTQSDAESVFGPVIFSYTREQAIEDGVLVDVSEVAKEAGIRYPVAVTRALWDGYIVPPEKTRASGQSEAGRLWDTLFMFAHHARHSEGSLFYYRVTYLNEKDQHETVTLKAHCGPGDDAAPVVTLMLRHED